MSDPDWWRNLYGMRRRVCPEPSIDSWDSGFMGFACSSGHTVVNVGVFPGYEWPSIDAMIELGTPQGHPCATCGSPAQMQFHELGTYLPMIRTEVILRVSGGQLTSIVAIDSAGNGQPIDRSHPVLGEIAPSSAARAAIGSVLEADHVDGRQVDAMAAVLKKWPDYAPALVAMAQMEKERGRPEAARSLLEEATRRAPDYAPGFFHLGDLLDETPEMETALRAYDRAVELDPTSVSAWMQRGIVLRKLGRAADAVASHQQALEIEPRHLKVINNLLLALDDEEEQARYVQQIRPSDLDDPSNGPLRGQLFNFACQLALKKVQKNEWEDALALHEVAARLDGRNERIPSVWYNISVCYRNVGLWNEALAAIRRARALNPQRPGIDREEADCFARANAMAAQPGVRAMRANRTLNYEDASGRPRRVLDYVVKIETTTQLIETEVARLSLEREKDLFKLLVAKGHNRRFAEGWTGRPIVFKLKQAPEDDFVRFASALRWQTPQGQVVESGVVPVLVGDTPIARPSSDVFVLSRGPAIERVDGDVAYPPEFAEYE